MCVGQRARQQRGWPTGRRDLATFHGPDLLTLDAAQSPGRTSIGSRDSVGEPPPGASHPHRGKYRFQKSQIDVQVEHENRQYAKDPAWWILVPGLVEQLTATGTEIRSRPVSPLRDHLRTVWTETSHRTPLEFHRLNELARSREEKGDRSNLCEAPYGPFRQIGPVPFFRESRKTI